MKRVGFASYRNVSWLTSRFRPIDLIGQFPGLPTNLRLESRTFASQARFENGEISGRLSCSAFIIWWFSAILSHKSTSSC
jgi:hypothetical protein